MACGPDSLGMPAWCALGAAAGLSALLLAPLAAQQPASSMLTVESPAPHRYTVKLPSGCRQQEGPGTIDAICSTEFDAEKSAEASAAASLVFEAGAETVADDAGKAGPALAGGYGEEAFKAELPEAVCGEFRSGAREDRKCEAGSRGGASCLHCRGALLRGQVPRVG